MLMRAAGMLHAEAVAMRAGISPLQAAGRHGITTNVPQNGHKSQSTMLHKKETFGRYQEQMMDVLRKLKRSGK